MTERVDRLVQAVADGLLASDVAERVTRWLTHPAYAAWSGKLNALVERDDFGELTRLFWREIPFGTGGRRGVMGPLGTATINERTIAESAHGLAIYLPQAGHEHGRVVIAHDVRHRSLEFARLAATTLAAHGLRVCLFDGFRATPTLSFAVRHLECVAGIVISASHNPPSDNGFKAYWSHGGQVLPPHDKGIISGVTAAESIPELDYATALADGRIELLGPEIDEAYREAVLATRRTTTRPLPAIYTPLHGVGTGTILPVLHQAGYTGVMLFEPQAEPDGDFPTVPDQLPNPERPEVFDLAIRQAQHDGAVLVMASDPDADRLGVAAPAADGNFHVLSGNQLGALLADHVLRHRRDDERHLQRKSYVVSTLVTTPLIEKIATHYGVTAVTDLLVGFKHIAGTIEDRGAGGFLFGCEESSGYLAGTYCRDKDGAGAALLVAELAAELHTENQSLWNRLEELYAIHGRVAEFQHAETAEGPSGQARISATMQALRHSPPTRLGQVSWNRVRDYETHEVRNMPDNQPIADLPSPTGNLVIFEADAGPIRVTLAARPSGTEPKIKFYGFAREMTPQPNGRPDPTVDDILGSVATGLVDFLDRQLSLPTDRETSADE